MHFRLVTKCRGPASSGSRQGPLPRALLHADDVATRPVWRRDVRTGARGEHDEKHLPGGVGRPAETGDRGLSLFGMAGVEKYQESRRE